MKKEKILYICGRKHLISKECSEWCETFKSALSKNVLIEKDKIETPYTVIEFVKSKPLFTGQYDFILNAGKQDDDAKLFALAIGKDY